MKKDKSEIHNDDSLRKMRPALSPEARENQLISLAVDLAEEQLRAGTASSQVVTHFLKLGSTKEKLDQDYLKSQKKLIDAKAAALKAEERIEELYKDALQAMQTYSGRDDDFYD